MDTLENYVPTRNTVGEEFDILLKLIDEACSSVQSLENSLAGVLRNPSPGNAILPPKDATNACEFRVLVYAAQAKIIALDAQIEALTSRVDL